MKKYYVVMDVQDPADVQEYIFHADSIKDIQTFFKNNYKVFMTIDLTRANLSEEDVINSKLDVYELPNANCTPHDFRQANKKYYENESDDLILGH